MSQKPATFPQPLSRNLLLSLPQEVQLYIQFLEAQVIVLTTQLAAQERRIQELEARLSKNSSNSGKPPSSDGLEKKPKTSSLRGKSGKKPGGQPGHIGKTLNPIDDPDKIEIYSPQTCQHCLKNLTNIEACSIDKRQVFDLPEVAVYVTEHQAETKKCPCCDHYTKATFPHNVTAPVQYGERAQALIAYFQHQHFIPPDRVAQLFKDLFNIPLSPGTCVNVNNRLFKNLETFEVTLKIYLLASKVLHFDETGFRCEKKLHWIHVTSSSLATFYGLHEKRGGEALKALNILPLYKGFAVHDCWMPYFAFDQVRHCLCNAHHLRELKYVSEQEKSPWATKMSDVLLNANRVADAARQSGQSQVMSQDIEAIERAYKTVLLEGARLYLSDPEEGQVHKAGCNLFKRLLCKMESVLAFIHNLDVPFTNNQAEQDIRMLKVKQKISGCFRAFSGGEISCRIRSYLSTSRKQGWRVWMALTEAVKGNPRLLPIS